MIHARLSDARRWSGAEHSGIDIDSRQIRPGSVFDALKGAHHDGHDLLDDARSNGAVAALVARPIPASPLPLLISDDAVWTLGELAVAWHQRFQLPVVTVLGSNGKTTIKELIAGVFRQQAGKAILVTPLHCQWHWKLWLSCRVKR